MANVLRRAFEVVDYQALMQAHVPAPEYFDSDFYLDPGVIEQRQLAHVPQHVGGMKGREDPQAVGQLDAAPDLGDSGLAVEERLGRDVAQRAEELRLDELDLLHQVGHAGGHLVELGRAVVRRAALENVGDVHPIPLHPDLHERLRQELTGPTDEGLALKILIAAGRLAHEHERRVQGAHSEHHLRPRLAQPALRALHHGLHEFQEFGRVLELCRFRRGRARFLRRHRVRGCPCLRVSGAFSCQRKKVGAEQPLHLEVALQVSVHAPAPSTCRPVTSRTSRSASPIDPR